MWPVAWLVYNFLTIPLMGGAGQHSFSTHDAQYQLKAAFIYHFTQYVEWPPKAFPDDPGAPIQIGILGSNPFGQHLENLVRGDQVQGRPLKVKPCKDVSEVEGCHVVFISRSENGRLSYILPRLRNKSILTIGETDEFESRGGIIRFVMHDNKIRFRINQKAAEDARLQISSKLLRLALNTREG